MKYFYLISLLSFFLPRVFAQNKFYSVSGIVVDSVSSQPLPFTAVAILKNKGISDTLIASTITNDSGTFFVTHLSGELKLKFSQVGYLEIEKIIKVESNSDLGIIYLPILHNFLEEVVVSGEKSPVTMGVEKRVFAVSKNITTIGGTAENLLRNIPSLSIGSDGSALLRNVNTTIYVNGKPTQLTLAQIPANQIESVELMTNPSAKYDASASSGIVNLVLKKNTTSGYNGSISAGYGTNSRFDLTVNQGLNLGKYNLSAMYSINSTKNPLTSYAYRTNKDRFGRATDYYEQNTIISLDNIFQNGRLNAEYIMNKSNTFSVGGNIVSGQYNSVTNQSFSNINSIHKTILHGERVTKPENNYTNAGAELDWKHFFAQKGKTISFTAGYSRNWVSNNANWYTTSIDTNGISKADYPETDKITGNTKGNQLIAQLDYVNPINDSTKWETGLRSFTYVRDQQYFFYKLSNEGNSFILLPTFSQNAKITEKVNAFYWMYTTKLKHKISIQGGLRVEQSSLEGLSRIEPTSVFGYNYPSSKGKNFVKVLFPSIAVTKELGNESQIGVSVSRKVGRPGWRQMFVGIQSNDRQNITIGNPGLQPEFVNTAELNYNKAWGKTNLLSTLYYILEDNTIKPTIYLSPTDPAVFVTTYTNVLSDIRSGFDNTLTTTLAKNLTVLANFNLFNVSLRTDTSTRALWTFNSKLNVSYRFPFNITAQINSNFDGPFPQLQGYRGPVRAIDFALRKSFWDNGVSIAFTINDVFNSRKQYLYYDVASAYQKSMSRREVRFFKVTLQYTINKAGTQLKKKDQKITKPDVDFGN